MREREREREWVRERERERERERNIAIGGYKPTDRSWSDSYR